MIVVIFVIWGVVMFVLLIMVYFWFVGYGFWSWVFIIVVEKRFVKEYLYFCVYEYEFLFLKEGLFVEGIGDWVD